MSLLELQPYRAAVHSFPTYVFDVLSLITIHLTVPFYFTSVLPLSQAALYSTYYVLESFGSLVSHSNTYFD